jgi:hypothetical protein
MQYGTMAGDQLRALTELTWPQAPLRVSSMYGQGVYGAQPMQGMYGFDPGTGQAALGPAGRQPREGPAAQYTEVGGKPSSSIGCGADRQGRPSIPSIRA